MKESDKEEYGAGDVDENEKSIDDLSESIFGEETKLMMGMSSAISRTYN